MKEIITCLLAVSCFTLIGGCAGSNSRNGDGLTEAMTTEAMTTEAITTAAITTEAAITEAAITESSTVKAVTAGNAGMADTAVSVSSDYIGEESARAAALQHAGLGEAEVTFIKSRLDYEGRRIVYEIEFYSGSTEYDYEVDAYTGDILEFDYDAEGHITESDKTVPGASLSGGASYITPEEAKQVSLDRVGLTEEQVTYREVSFDFEDGAAVYQIEFVSDGKEYELEISAVSGEILEYSVESYRR